MIAVIFEVWPAGGHKAQYLDYAARLRDDLRGMDGFISVERFQSLLHSVTSKWPAMKEKVWAMFYWTHLAKRQTAPMITHGIWEAYSLVETMLTRPPFCLAALTSPVINSRARS